MTDDSWSQKPGYAGGQGYAKWKVQKDSPGTGWKYVGQNATGKNIWEYRPGNSTAPPPKNPGGGTPYASGGGGNGASGAVKPLTAADIHALTLRCKSLFGALFTGVAPKTPDELIKQYISLRGNMGGGQMLAMLRETPKLQSLYMKTTVADTREEAADTLLQGVFGAAYKKNDKEMKALRVKYALGDPDNKSYLNDEWFRKYVMKSPQFVAKYAGFKTFLNTAEGMRGDPFAAFGVYKGRRDLYEAAYRNKFGVTALIPPDLLAKAILGNWVVDANGNGDAMWTAAIANDPSWAGVTGYADRIDYFNQQWKAIFGDSPLGNITPPADIAKKFGQTTGEPSAEFNRIFQTSIRNSEAFKSVFPDFESYALATFKRTGVSDVDVGDYLTRRADYIERYKSILEDPDAMPDAALLAKAMASNWSNTQWDLTIEKNDPKYKTTEAYKEKQAAKVRKVDDFNTYWHRIFGESSTPDQGLLAEYVDSASTDTSSMWESVKSTGEFQSQYAQWDAFAKAQNDQGVNVMEDPGLYKQYQKAFYDAFANQGMQAPQGFDRMFFASGIDTNAFASNIAQYGQQAGAYQWQSGQDADLATVAGIADKVAGGDLRKRLDAAIKQHSAYAQSKFQDFQTQSVGDSLAKKI